MKCINCDFENEQTFQYCPNCGSKAQPETVSQNPAADKILSALKDSLFLVICILMSAVCLLSLANDGMPLISLLTTVFLWLTYAQSRKDIADPKHLRCVSGTVYAQYVISYVAAGLFLVVGIIFAVVFNMLSAQPEFLDAILEELMDTSELHAFAPGLIASVSGWLLFIIFAVIAAGMILINIFAVRRVHRFAKSVYQSIEAQTLKLENASAASIWLFVFSAFSAIGGLSALTQENLLSGLTYACNCAIAIIAGILIRKHLLPEV